MTTRRTILKGGLAAAALTSAPSIIKTKAQPAAARTVKAVMHADLRVLACAQAGRKPNSARVAASEEIKERRVSMDFDVLTCGPLSCV